MKIQDVSVGVYSHDLERPIMDSRFYIPKRKAVLVRVDTDEDFFGIGESMFVGGPPVVTKSIIESEIKPYLLGENPLRVDYLWEKFYQGTMQHGRKGALIAAYSGVDQALWDIIGKKMSLSVHKLLGGFRDTLKAYASGGFYKENGSIEELVQEMKEYKEEGFKIMKMKIGRLSLKEDLERVKAVREAVGDDVKLAVDANNAYTPTDACKMARRLSKLDIFFFEEPLPPENRRAYANLISRSDVPISSGEIEFTRYGFKDLIANNSVDIIQPDASWSGGLTEGKKIVDLASAWHIPAVPHSFSSAFAFHANMHLVGSSYNCFGPVGGRGGWYTKKFEEKQVLGGLIELDRNPNPLRSEFMGNVEIEDGRIKIPDEPGLGVDLDTSDLDKYREGGDSI